VHTNGDLKRAETEIDYGGFDMPKQWPVDGDILKRRFTARLTWVKPRRQRAKFSRRCTAVHLRRRGHPTPISCTRQDEPGLHSTLIFERERPEAAWVVPAVAQPLYYFDTEMMRKQLIIFKAPDTFTIPGSDRVFKLVAREQVHRTFWNRYLVVEVRDDLPHRGLP
jgi:hypothetical protein